jgi:hypothetical protein
MHVLLVAKDGGNIAYMFILYLQILSAQYFPP